MDNPAQIKMRSEDTEEFDPNDFPDNEMYHRGIYRFGTSESEVEENINNKPGK